MGAIFGRDQKAYDRWRRSNQPAPVSLTGDRLEAAVMGIAAMFPDNVIRGTL